MTHHGFSHRLPWEAVETRLSKALAERRRRGEAVVDLTISLPTGVGLPYPEAELAAALARGATTAYTPHPLGLPAARQALAEDLSRDGDAVEAEDLVLTASTSEAYSYLFKLFAEPGDEILTAAPSYPLLDSLAALDGLVLRQFPLEPGRRFRLDPGALERALTGRTRLLVLVHPTHPLGGFLSPAEQDMVVEICRRQGLPLVSDEVFADYPLIAPAAFAGAAAARRETLCISLGGLSKSAGLPAWKLAWIRVGGPRSERRRVVAALELIADSYLSVASPVQQALGDILRLAPRIRDEIRQRLVGNLERLRRSLAAHAELELIEPQGGWSAVLRVPNLGPDEELAVNLLEACGVLVQPGHLFDFAQDGYLVVSLLTEPQGFVTGVGHLLAHLSARR